MYQTGSKNHITYAAEWTKSFLEGSTEHLGNIAWLSMFICLDAANLFGSIRSNPSRPDEITLIISSLSSTFLTMSQKIIHLI